MGPSNVLRVCEANPREKTRIGACLHSPASCVIRPDCLGKSRRQAIHIGEAAGGADIKPQQSHD